LTNWAKMTKMTKMAKMIKLTKMTKMTKMTKITKTDQTGQKTNNLMLAVFRGTCGGNKVGLYRSNTK